MPLKIVPPFCEAARLKREFTPASNDVLSSLHSQSDRLGAFSVRLFRPKPSRNLASGAAVAASEVERPAAS